MSEGLGDFFKLIAEDKKNKKEERKELLGEVDIDSIFSQVKESIVEDKKASKKIQKQAAAFESWLFSETEEKREEIVAEVAEEFKEEVEEVVEEVVEVEEEIVEEPEVEEEISLVEKSLGLLSEPSENIPGAEQNFATLDDLQKHYKEFLVKIQQQLSTLGGGGIEDAPKTGGPYVRQGQKWVVSSGGGSGITTANINADTLNVSGVSTFQDNVHLGDGDILLFGDSNDLQISHDGSNSWITDAGTGYLGLVSNGTGVMLQKQGGEFLGKFLTDGAVELYYDNSKKFETTDYGVTITGIASATNVSIANTFTYPEYITGGTVPRAIKSQGGYDRTSAFVDFQTATEASQDPADYIEYTQELANTETWMRFGMSTAGNQARDGQWWGETNPNYDQSKGLFGGLTAPAGVDHFFDFSDNTAFNNAQTTGSLKYTQALGSFSLKECQVGDLVLARFDFNVMPMVTNTTVQVALIYSNRDENDNITFTFPLTITPFFYGSGSVGKGFLLRPTITAYMANQQDVNSRSLVAIKADNPILVNPIGVLFTIQR